MISKLVPHDLYSKIRLLLDRGFFHIFSSKLINRLVRFATSFVIVRLLDKETYGAFSWALNIINFFIIMNGLGVAFAILQFCSERKKTEDKLPFLKYGAKIGVVFDIIVIIFFVLFLFLFDLPVEGSKEILILLVLLPLFMLFQEILGNYLRSDYKNKKYSFIYIINTLLFFFLTLAGGYFFKVYGIVFARYLAFAVSVALGIKFIYKDLKVLRNISEPPKQQKREFLKYSVIASFNVSITQILFLLDIFFVGLIIPDNSVIASYKVATLIPFGLSFIPSSVMAFAYPYFSSNYKNAGKVKKYFYELQKYMMILNLFITLLLVLFAPLIIRFVFGNEFSDAVLPFRILCFGYFIGGSFRATAGNVLASLRKININLYNGIICGVLNVGLDIILIYRYGSIGAAIATVSILFLSSLISNSYLYSYFKKQGV